MIALLQRVTYAHVEVDGQLIGQIAHGLLVFFCAQPNDREEQVPIVLNRVLNYRVFADAGGKMNRSVRDVAGGVLLVPQFTLAADTRSGLRPSFSTAASPQRGRELFDCAWQTLQTLHPNCARGAFGADMKVSLLNDGPATFWLQS